MKSLPILLLLAGCSTQDEAPSFNRVVLRDVHALWGGQNLYLNADGTGIAEIAGPRETKRYPVELKKKQIEALEELLRGFDKIETRKRDGRPDEARPEITVTQGKESVTKAKWVGDEHKEFDAIYDTLKEICSEAGKTKPIFEGTYDPDWRPEGWDRTKR